MIMRADGHLKAFTSEVAFDFHIVVCLVSKISDRSDEFDDASVHMELVKRPERKPVLFRLKSKDATYDGCRVLRLHTVPLMTL